MIGIQRLPPRACRVVSRPGSCQFVNTLYPYLSKILINEITRSMGWPGSFENLNTVEMPGDDCVTYI
jgi:hypothetical protein